MFIHRVPRAAFSEPSVMLEIGGTPVFFQIEGGQLLAWVRDGEVQRTPTSRLTFDRLLIEIGPTTIYAQTNMRGRIFLKIDAPHDVSIKPLEPWMDDISEPVAKEPHHVVGVR